MFSNISQLSPILIDAFVILIFLGLWISYYLYSRRAAKKRNSLSSAMKVHRISAINNAMDLENKTTGVTILSNIDRHVSFLASTSLLLLASLMGLLTKVTAIQQVVNDLPYAYILTTTQVYLRLLTLIGIFVYAYFTQTWSLRQSSFTSVMIGAGIKNGTESDNAYAELTAKLMDISAHSANQGLRAYYFSLAALTWFYHPLAFISSCIIVLSVLYRREFNSTTARLLIEAKTHLP